MRYYSDYTSVVAKIDPGTFVAWLERHGFSHVQRKRTDVWHGCREKDGKFWIDVPLDRSLADYSDAMIRALGVAADAEKTCILGLLTLLVPCRAYMDRDMFLGRLEDRSYSKEEIIRLAGECTGKYEFDSWNPWPAVEPPANRKLRITLECIADSRKCRDAVWLTGKPQGFTRLRYTAPGWYMSLTGERIDDDKVKAWLCEIPYKES